MKPALPIPETALNALRAQWYELFAPATGAAVARAWANLQAAYSASTRHYHNLTHIQALLHWAELYRAELQDYTAVRLAIWYHDVVYQTRRKDNEERSAELARQELAGLNVPAATLVQVAAMIRATNGHCADGLDEDGRWFLDFDLAILGSAPEIYQAYSQAIRREYRWVLGPLYRRGRRQVLETFLQREQLFFTAPLRARLEAQARANLRAELAQLA